MCFWSLTFLCSHLSCLDHLLPMLQRRTEAGLRFSRFIYPSRRFPNSLPQQGQLRAAVWAFSDIPPSLCHVSPAAHPPASPHPPTGTPKLQAPGLNHRVRALLSSTSCVAAWGRGEEKATLKPPPNLFSTLEAVAHCGLPAATLLLLFFFFFFPFHLFP